MARALVFFVGVAVFTLLLMAFVPQTTLVNSPTGYFSMQVKENPGMVISRHYFSEEELVLINEKKGVN